MGNPKLRFSEFIPNSWFHKPKALHRHQPTTRPPPISSAGELPLSISPPRKSYHFTRNLIAPKSSEIDSPRKSPKRRIRRKPVAQKSNPSEACNHVVPNSSKLIRDDDRSGFSGQRKTGDSVSIHELRPIKTERDKFSDLGKKIASSREAIDDPNVKHRSSGKFRERRENGGLLSVNAVREESTMASSVCSFKEQGSRSVRRSSNGSPRIRIRIHSPRLARRVQVNSSRVNLSSSPSKKGVSSKSLAVVKSSSDPQRDFRESMMEMIVENNIRASKDLEELLACYLSLNSDQYHDVIIQAFTQIWFDLNNIIKHIRK